MPPRSVLMQEMKETAAETETSAANGSLTDAQRSAIETMTTRALAHGVDTDEFCAPSIIRRFLVARKFDVDAAYTLWEGWVRWKLATKPELVTKDMVSKEMQTGKAKIDGCDKTGRPCVVVKIKDHRTGEFPIADTLNLTYHIIESALSHSREHADGYISAIFDCKDVSLRNWDLPLLVKKPGLVQVVQDCYPECLASLTFVNTNMLFRMCYRLVEPWFDEHLRSKIRVVSRVEDLLETYEMEGLPEEYRPVIDA